MNHNVGEHFSEDIMYYIGCDLWGYKCEHSSLPYWQCSIHKLPEQGHPALIEFVKAGVYSLPCHNYRQCGHWILFRQAHFEINENMERKWKALGWRKGGKRKYFTCPDCIRDEDTSSSGAVRGREMVTMKVSWALSVRHHSSCGCNVCATMYVWLLALLLQSLQYSWVSSWTVKSRAIVFSICTVITNISVLPLLVQAILALEFRVSTRTM